MNNNLVSIVTPLYNGETFIERTIQSVLNQTYSNWELLIVDDASTDNSVDIIERYKKIDTRIKPIFKKENTGAGETRNMGIKAAKGRYIAFLDSDDSWDYRKLEDQISFMENNSYYFTYTLYSYYDEDEVLLKKSNKAPFKCNYQKLLLRNYIGCSTVIIDIEHLGKKYMHSIRSRQDWALWLSYLKVTNFAYGMQHPLTNYTIRKDSVSSSKTPLIKYHWKIYREVLSYNSIVSAILLGINLILLTYNHFIVKRV